jgi:hypothetical protein
MRCAPPSSPSLMGSTLPRAPPELPTAGGGRTSSRPQGPYSFKSAAFLSPTQADGRHLSSRWRQ